MPSWKTLFKNEKYIGAVEFGDKKPTLTITKIESVKFEQDDGKEKERAVIFFKEVPRAWIFCKSSGFCLSSMFGEDYTNWIGKRVTLHSELVQVGPEKMPGIRVTGSPDIDKPISVKIKLAKKKAFIVKLVPTGSKETLPPPSIDQNPSESPVPATT